MSEIVCFIITGIILEAIGALIIINPIYFWKKRTSYKEMMEQYTSDMKKRQENPSAEIYSNDEELERRRKSEKEKFIDEQFMELVKPSRILAGVSIFIIGIIIQIIGLLFNS